MSQSISLETINIILSVSLFSISVIIPLVHMSMLSRTSCIFSGLQEIVLKYSLFFNIGCSFLIGFAAHFLYPLEMAACTGWSESPFQYELGFSELALASMGFLCALFNYEFWLATIIASSIWLLGTASVQLVQGGIAFGPCWNIVIALWHMGLYCLFYKTTQRTIKQWLIGQKFLSLSGVDQVN
jgi:hypothetical protein